MQKEEHRLLGYEFTYVENEKYTYNFQTGKDVVYEAIFKPSGYVFPDLPEALKADVFSTLR